MYLCKVYFRIGHRISSMFIEAQDLFGALNKCKKIFPKALVTNIVKLKRLNEKLNRS